MCGQTHSNNSSAEKLAVDVIRFKFYRNIDYKPIILRSRKHILKIYEDIRKKT